MRRYLFILLFKNYQNSEILIAENELFSISFNTIAADAMDSDQRMAFQCCTFIDIFLEVSLLLLVNV